MNLTKILLIIIVLISVVSAFTGIPYLGAITAIVGLVYGIMAVEDDRRVYFLVVAVVLATGAGALGGIPEVGSYLTAILTTLGGFASAGAIGVIGKGIAARLM
ncbi:MAG: hypothetical protein ACI810_002960 [Gammaproteobacteria bacterium]|jgi:hypothetical protein